MKTWNVPVVEELNVAVTASGAVDDTVENTNAGFMNGSWHISSYNSSTSEKTSCGDGRYTISDIKTSTVGSAS